MAAMALVERTKLDPGSAEYREVEGAFNAKCVIKGGKMLQIVSIERAHNNALEQRFLLKKQHYEQKYGHVRVVRGWHGTKGVNISPILQNNFDVSRHGQGVGHRFGAGVSFSSMASYASYYCDKTSPACMLLNDVLVSEIVEVPENKSRLLVLREPPVIPGRAPLRYDTTAKNKTTMDVFVKFDKDSFLPRYVVQFKTVGLAAGDARRHYYHDLSELLLGLSVDDDDFDYGGLVFDDCEAHRGYDYDYDSD